MQKKLIITADNSNTIYVPELDEHYHSTNGSIQEAMHVYINAALIFNSEFGMRNSELRVLEIGFGTGLNAFLTLIEAEKSLQSIKYYTLEKYPLSGEIYPNLNYTSLVNPALADKFLRLHTTLWDKDQPISEYFTINKMLGDANEIEIPQGIDIVYFDAFGPDKQPDLWNQELFNKIYAAMNEGGVLTTYCAKGVVRRMMQTAGFKVERIPGPIGKREMLRAFRILNA